MHKASKTTVACGLTAALACSGFLGVPGAIAAQQSSDAYSSEVAENQAAANRNYEKLMDSFEDGVCDSGTIAFKEPSGGAAEQSKSAAAGKRQVTMSAVYKKSGKLVIKIKNNSAQEATFGQDESLYRRKGGKWKKLKALPGYSYESIAYILKPGKSRSVKTSLSCYGKLKSGTYKIKKEVTLKGKDITVSAKFKVK